MIELFIFVFGVCIGSFLNVCIHRMPQEKSIVSPGSHCPACKAPVKWIDNIPLLSYLVLGAKCRQCKVKISPRYFAIELLNGLAWLGFWLVFGPSPMFFAGIVFVSILIAVTATDLETGLIPDALTLPGMLFGLVFCTFFPSVQGESVWYWGLLKSLIGLLAGSGAMIAIALFGNWVFKKESMGGGDIKLIAMIGAFIGWRGALFVFFFSPFLALPIGLFVRLVKQRDTIPFGPYIALAGLLYYFYSDWVNQYIFYF